MAVAQYADRTMASHESMARMGAIRSGAEAVAGAGALVLAMLGLAGMLPMILASIAVIGGGAAFLFQGAAVAARDRRLALEAGGGDVEIEAGMSAEILVGLAGIILGILALIGIATISLLAISAIVFGGTWLFGSPAVYRASRAEPEVPIFDVIARETAAGACERRSINSFQTHQNGESAQR